jgi:hypothetical protein
MYASEQRSFPETHSAAVLFELTAEVAVDGSCTRQGGHGGLWRVQRHRIAGSPVSSDLSVTLISARLEPEHHFESDHLDGLGWPGLSDEFARLEPRVRGEHID